VEEQISEINEYSHGSDPTRKDVIHATSLLNVEQQKHENQHNISKYVSSVLFGSKAYTHGIMLLSTKTSMVE
jgi:hypothetical protein